METERITQPLNLVYKEKIIQSLLQKFNYENIHQVPKLVKIQINRGLGADGQNNAILKK